MFNTTYKAKVHRSSIKFDSTSHKMDNTNLLVQFFILDAYVWLTSILGMQMYAGNVLCACLRFLKKGSLWHAMWGAFLISWFCDSDKEFWAFFFFVALAKQGHFLARPPEGVLTETIRGLPRLRQDKTQNKKVSLRELRRDRIDNYSC